MSARNRTIATEFVLLGFTTDLRVNIFLFVLFLAIYIVTFAGNCLLMCLIVLNPQLHRPMYFFLCILAVLDLCTSTAVVPRLLADVLSTRRSISYTACAFQFYTIMVTVGTECFLFALMAYDRYVAICRPLHYPVLMSWRTCYCLTALVWVVTFIIIVIPTISTPVDLCYPNQINHFMCDALAVVQLACDDIFINQFIMSLVCFSSLFIPLVVIFASYICILSSVLKIPSAGRSKAFSTCGSHVTVVSLAYGFGMVTYFNPSSQHATKHGKYLSVFSLAICPAINPLIYSLNNKDVKDTMRNMFLKPLPSRRMEDK
ncbi:olfactory receptor 5AR1-like [Leptodactylus fuscus]